MALNYALLTAKWRLLHDLAPDRFDKFISPTDGDEADHIARYLWNVALCEALYGTAHLIEIGLRNATHNALSVSRGRPDWYEDGTFLLPGEMHKVCAAKVFLERNNRTAKGAKPMTPGRIVAELHFGFWHSLYSKPYDKSVFNRIGLQVFPVAPKTLSRAMASNHIRNIKDLRNRAFHHEPICFFPNLQHRWDNAIELVSWLGPPITELEAATINFEAIRNTGCGPFRAPAIAALGV